MLSTLVLSVFLACAHTGGDALPPAELAGPDAAAAPEALEAPEAPSVALAEAGAAALSAAAEASTPPPADAAMTCLSSADCGTNMVCEGLGCGDDQPGQCKSAQRPCTADLHPFCGCDGATLLASSTCPGARYSASMPCAESAP